MSRSAVVMGGSLGGLNAALYLRDAGFTVDVFERSRVPLEGQGAGIVLNPATVRYLVDNAVVDVAEISEPASILRYLGSGGEVAAEHPEPYRFSAYTALYRALLDCLDRSRYHLGEEVRSFSQDAGSVTVQLASGRSVRADLLVCADGIRSTAREQLVPAARPRYAGYVAWRGTVDAPASLSAETRAALHDAIVYCVMPNSHMLAYLIPATEGDGGGGERLNWLWYRNVAEGPELEALMTDSEGTLRSISLPPGFVPAGRIAGLRDEAAERLPRQLAEIVHATAEPFIQAIFDIEVPRMAFGRACLIGDAAFAARPHAAAGSAKAAEDAFQLGEALVAARGDVPAALAAWEPPQLDLGRSVLARTREAGEQSQFTCTWEVGRPLPFGLHRVGDSAMVRTP